MVFSLDPNGISCEKDVYKRQVLGKRVLVPSGAHIAGNCIVGDDVWVGVNATVSNRISIGDGARVSLGSVVTKDVPAGQTVTGNFAIDHKKDVYKRQE